MAFLFRVPAFIRHPTGARGGEVQRGPLHIFAGEYAVAGGQHFVKLFFLNVFSWFFGNLGFFYHVDREITQAIFGVALSIQMPIAAVVH